jgi:hypothetical protein
MKTHVRNTVLATAVILAHLAATDAYGAPPGSPSLRGSLVPGPHAVGFKAIHTYDLSRPPIRDPETSTAAAAPGRAMQILVWYPARPEMPVGGTSPAAPMTLGDYAAHLSQEIDFSPLTPQRIALGRRKLESDLVDWGADPRRLEAVLDTLLATRGEARAGASPAEARFPLVIYPAYRAPATNSILAEHLASHGFVVASTTTKGTSETELDVALTGIESMTLDLAFVLATMNREPNVDASRVGLIGSGISATACFALRMRNPAIDALVSLDGGVITPSEDRMIRATPYYDVAAVRIPILAIWAPHPDVDPRRLEVYRYSDRTVLGFPRMKEQYFQNKGALEGISPGLLGEPREGAREGSEWASRYVTRFLAAMLADDADSRVFLALSPEENGAPRGLAERSVAAKLPATPALVEAKEIVRAQGIERLFARLDELARSDPHPFAEQKYVDLYGWLSWKRDEDWTRRRALSAHFVRAFPRSSRAHIRAGRVAQQLGDKASARRSYELARSLVDADPDPVLDLTARRGLKEQIEKLMHGLAT